MSYGGRSTSKYASSQNALALCDRCGFPYPLRVLKREFYDQRPNGLKVCPTCFDIDQPQLQLGRIRVNDPQSLRDPRPDIDYVTSTSYFGWQPVGNPITNTIFCQLGAVTITVNGVVQ
jgi:hypothetical protein